MAAPDWVELNSTLVKTEIVDIVQSELAWDPRAAGDPVICVPLDQGPASRASFVIRTTGDPFAAALVIHQAV